MKQFKTFIVNELAQHLSINAAPEPGWGEEEEVALSHWHFSYSSFPAVGWSQGYLAVPGGADLKPWHPSLGVGREAAESPRRHLIQDPNCQGRGKLKKPRPGKKMVLPCTVFERSSVMMLSTASKLAMLP